MRFLAGRQIYLCAVSFLLGAVAVQGLAELPPNWVSLVAVSLALPCFAFRSLQPLFWLLLGFVWTILRADLVLTQELPEELDGKDIVMEGVVDSLVRRTGPDLKFTVSTVAAASFGEHSVPPMKILLRWYRTDEDVRLGQGWRLKVRLKRPHGFQNPGGFDREKWLFRHRIRATGYVRNASRLPGLDRAAWWGEFRERLQHHLRRSDLANQGLIRALVIGDRSGVSEEQWRVLIRTGTLHLLAISGLHIGLVAGFCFVLGSIVCRILGQGLLWFPAPMAGAIGAVLGGGLYALLAGLTIPTQRAFVMVATVMTAVLLGRSVDIVRCLAIALILILAVDPLSVLDAGLWMSFGAVAAILAASKATTDTGNRVLRVIKIQLILTLLMAPLVLVFFGQVSLVAPVANLIAIPVVAFTVVPLVLCASASLGFGWLVLAEGLYGLANGILSGLFCLLSVLSEPDWAVWVTGRFGTILVVGAICLAIVVVRQRSRYLLATTICLLPLLVVHSLSAGNKISPGDFTLTILDVGQGLSVVLRTRNHSLLYDTGARFGPRFDAGNAVVVPYLRHQGIDSLDMLIVSHGDNDHIGGMRAVLSGLPVGLRLTSVPDKVPEASSCVAGDQWEWDGVRFLLLSPRKAHPPEHNNASCVVKVLGRSGSALLTGDIEREIEDELVAHFGQWLQSDVLLVPHQGSKTSSTVQFVDRVAPDIAIVAAGYRNRYGHPAEAVVDRYRDRGIRLFNTARDGAVTVRLAKGIIATESYRVSQRRYWFDDVKGHGYD